MVLPTQPLPFVCLNSANQFEGPKTFPMPESMRKLEHTLIPPTRMFRKMSISESGTQRTLLSDHNMKFINGIDKTNSHLPPVHLAQNVVNRVIHSSSQGNMHPGRNDFYGSSYQLNRRNDYNGDHNSENHSKTIYPRNRKKHFSSTTNLSQPFNTSSKTNKNTRNIPRF